MKTVTGINRLRRQPKKTVVALGVFDGVHRGHRLIIDKVVKEAGRIKGMAVALTFDPHPLFVLSPGRRPPRLMSLSHKLRMFEELGIDMCVVMRFSKKLAGLEPEKFVKRILADKLNASKIFVGDNFTFGKDKKGSWATLKAAGALYDFSVINVAPVRSGETIISSSLIRKLIAAGNLPAAEKLLGRPVSVLGTVVKGDRRGRSIGFPTANIDPHHESIPPSGVYAVKIKLQNRLFFGILNIGRCPTFRYQEAEPRIEAHIFNLRRDIYGRDLEVLFIKKIREERCFASREALVDQIKKDLGSARKILKT